MNENILRLCRVNGRLGYLHQWVSHPEKDTSACVIFGIVEFEDEMAIVNMSDVKFCDSIHDKLCDIIKVELQEKGWGQRIYI